jgi:hypothetical protein
MTFLLKAGIAEPKETSIVMLQKPKEPAIAKQRLCKQVPVAMNTGATMDELMENIHTTIEK